MSEQKWSSSAGPRQLKKFSVAVRALEWRGKSWIELGDFGRSQVADPFAEPSQAAQDAAEAIGEQYGWEINRGSCKHAEQAFLDAAKALVLPVIDKRSSSAELDERQKRMESAAAERAVARAEENANHEAIMAKIPDDAAALIVAELHEDKSELESDYHNHIVSRRVVIGWRKGKRENFAKLREAAAGFSESAHLGPGCDVWSIRRQDDEGRSRLVGADGQPAWSGKQVEFLRESEAAAMVAEKGWSDAVLKVEKVEHRENYSMGAGNYLKAGFSDSSGWAVKSVDPKGMGCVVYEDGLPGADAPKPNGKGPAPAPRPESPGKLAKRVERLRGMADKLDEVAKDGYRERETNTARKLSHAMGSRREAGKAERAAGLMRAFADVIEAEQHFSSDLPRAPKKSDFMGAADKVGKMVSNGYHAYYVDGSEWYDNGPAAVALRELAESAKSDADRQADDDRQRQLEIERLENDVRFSAIPGFFPTPEAVVSRMLDEADIEAGDIVAEPSAGIGSIVEAILDREPDAKLILWEVVPSLSKILAAKFPGVPVCGDFLAEPGGEFDRIVMNPPFERGQDAVHVKHAFGKLKSGGRLVAVMANGAQFAKFSPWLDEVGGWSEPLPADAFKGKQAFRQTGVSTRLVVIDK